MARRLVPSPRRINHGKCPSDWTPSRENKRRLLEFEGYGADDPDIVFVGLEEYCDGDLEKQRENIWRRTTSPSYQGRRVDKDRSLAALGGTVKTDVPVWDMMASIVAGLTLRTFDEERAALGSRPARHLPSTWLTELRPLPRPTVSAWKGTYLPLWFSDVFPRRADFDNQLGSHAVTAALRRVPAPLVVFFYGLPAGRWAEKTLQHSLRKPLRNASVCRVGTLKNGTVVATTGFFDGQDGKTALRPRDVPKLCADVTAELGRCVVWQLTHSGKPS